MGLGCHPVPDRQLLLVKAQLLVIAQQHFRVENSHYQFLAKRSRHGGEPQLNFLAVAVLGFDPAVLRQAFFRNIHPAQNFQAAQHRVHNRHRQLINIVQNTVDPEPHIALLAARLDVNIAGALVERILQQPVDQIDHMLIVGVQIGAFTQLDQLFEILAFRRAAIVMGLRAFQRLGKVIKLVQIALDLVRIGKHAANFALMHFRQIELPGADEGLCGGYDNFVGVDFDRQDIVIGGIRLAKQGCDGGDVDF